RRLTLMGTRRRGNNRCALAGPIVRTFVLRRSDLSSATDFNASEAHHDTRGRLPDRDLIGFELCGHASYLDARERARMRWLNDDAAWWHRQPRPNLQTQRIGSFAPDRIAQRPPPRRQVFDNDFSRIEPDIGNSGGNYERRV